MKIHLLRYSIITLLLWLPFCASAQTYAAFGDSAIAWMQQRVANAAAHRKEIVEMPLAVRSRAWGCKCPDHFIGESPDTQEGPWIWVEAKGRFPKVDEKGYSLVVIGQFTGTWKTQDLRNDDGEPKEWLYKMPVFKVTSWRKNTGYGEAPAPHVLVPKH